jgi:GrpB-like predicted nucleotidyltransferase (UPF0157 family)
MAKVTIEFDSIEDQHELDVCINGGKWYTLAWQLDQYLRDRLKYEPMSDKQYEVLQQTRDKLHELRTENGLTFD